MNSKKLFGEIYKITNFINNKIYIGKAQVSCYGKTPSIGRFNQHIKIALNENKKDDCPYLNKAIRKYNKDNFKVDVLFQLFGEFKSIELCKLEKKYGNENPCFGNDGYNCRSFENNDSIYSKRLEYGMIIGKNRVCFKEGCIHNKQLQLLANFFNDKKIGIDGKGSICKDCYKKKRENTKININPKCITCNKPLSNINNSTGRCKECYLKENLHKGRKHTEESLIKMREKQKNKKPHTKTYEVIKPNKDIIITSNLKEFCKANNLRYKSMLEVVAGRIKTHKGGWICNKIYEKKTTKSEKRKYLSRVKYLKSCIRDNKRILQNSIDNLLVLEKFLIKNKINFTKYTGYLNYSNIIKKK